MDSAERAGERAGERRDFELLAFLVAGFTGGVGGRHTAAAMAAYRRRLEAEMRERGGVGRDGAERLILERAWCAATYG